MAAPTTTDFSTANKEGVDFNQTYTVSATAPEYPAAPFNVGEIAAGTDGTEYMFIKAGAALAKYQTVAIDKTMAAAVPATITLVNQQARLGWPQVAIANGDYGWAAIRGTGIGVLAKKGSLANSKLYVSGTSPGSLTSTSVRTSALVASIVLTTSATSVAGFSNSHPTVAVATWPRGLV